MTTLEHALSSGPYDRAMAVAEPLTRAAPDTIDRIVKIGRSHEKGGRPELARLAYDVAIACAEKFKIPHTGAYRLAAAERFRSGEIEAAHALAERAVALGVPDADVLRLRAQILFTMNDNLGARRSLEQALQLHPGNVKLVFELGSVLISLAKRSSPGSTTAQNLYAEAESRLARTLAENKNGGLEPRQHVKMVETLVSAMLNQRKYQQAHDLIESLPLAIRRTDAIVALKAHVLFYWGRHDEAERTYREALSIDPGNREALQEYAVALAMRGDLDSAAAQYEKLGATSGRLDDFARDRSHLLLAQGKPREGWKAYMTRVEAKAFAKLDGIRVWDGSSLQGRSIMVVVEGGTGDELRDAACYGQISTMAERCSIVCDPRLESLFSRSFSNARFVPLSRVQRVSPIEKTLSRLISPEVLEQMRAHDVCVLSPDLFYHLKPEPELYGTTESFLKADPALRQTWRARLDQLGPGKKIGITWRSATRIYRVDQFYTRLLDWGPVLTMPGFHFINLQYDECEQELLEAERAFGIRIARWPDLNLKDDFDSVAALTRELDMVIAPNTTNLELAGAVGAPTRYAVNTMQPIDHWRLKDRGTGQDRLYPSVRLIVASRPGDTSSLMQKLAAELHAIG